VRELKLFKAMTAGGETVVEYLAALEGPAVSGEASVKLIHSPNPVEALRKYYEWEKQTTRGRIAPRAPSAWQRLDAFPSGARAARGTGERVFSFPALHPRLCRSH